MQHVIQFLDQLRTNNNREWFHAHKSEYQDVRQYFDDFALRLLHGIQQFDESIGNLAIENITYRINRDIRFSADKSPYKTHIGVYIAPQGKKSGYSGYYFHVSAAQEGWMQGHMVAAGDYICDSKVLKTLREDIAYGGDEFQQLLDQSDSRFHLDYDNSLKRVPNGFAADSPVADFLRLRNFCLCYAPGDDFVYAPHLVERLVDIFRTAQPFIHYINRAIAYTNNLSQC